MKIEHLRQYRCKIILRPEFEGRKLKQGVAVVDGMELILEALWQQDEEDNYPNEWAMGDSCRIDSEHRLLDLTDGVIGWISSGDLQIIEEIKI